MDIQCIWQGSTQLGEGPLWHPVEEKLYWVDILGKVLYQYNPNTRQTIYWSMPDYINCIAPREQGGLIAALNQDIVFIDTENGSVNTQMNILSELPGMMFNDGKCDPQGRFWVGTTDRAKGTPSAVLYRIDPDLSVHEIEHGLRISNGLGWSPDSNIFYHTDSPLQQIYQYDFDTTSGTISNKTILVDISQQSFGYPDGLTVDAEGYLWSAHWDGWRITRYAPDGNVDQVIKMPVQRATSCAFGNKNLATLYVTTASLDFGEDKPLAAPAGSVYAITGLSTGGLKEPVFKG